MVSAGAPASNLAVQPPAASTEAVDLTAEATIREDPGAASATAAAAFFHVLSFLLLWSYQVYLKYSVCTHYFYCLSRGFIHCYHVLSSLLHPA